VQKTVKDEAVVGLRPKTISVQASSRLGPIAAIAATLQSLVHPRIRTRAVDEASVETGQVEGPKRDRDVYRSPMEAGVTGGFSLLMGNPDARRRR
jgi:hypothetical protein